MASVKEVRLRIKSVESTMQITNAMKLVASAKFKKAKNRLDIATPYFETLYEAISEIALNSKDLSSVYTRDIKVEKKCFVVIAGDTGFAGGYNSNILRLATSMIDFKTDSVIAIGKKAVDFFSKRGLEPTLSYQNIGETADMSSVKDVANTVCEMFKTKQYSEVQLIYTSFISQIQVEPNTIKLLPINTPKGERVNNYMIYEPSPKEVFETIVPQYLTGMIYCAIVESYASEQGARRTAMESATDNAQEMIDDLSLLYNRARQAAITQEITEIVAGAEGLN